MFVYLVWVSDDRVKFGLTKDRKNVESRIRTYRTIVPDCYYLGVWEVHDSNYVEKNLKQKFEAIRIENSKGRKSEVIKLPAGTTHTDIVGIVEGIVERSNVGFPTETRKVLEAPSEAA